MKETVGSALEVKASGGIRDFDTAMAMINAGADRIGASASVAIMEAYQNQAKENQEKENQTKETEVRKK